MRVKIDTDQDGQVTHSGVLKLARVLAEIVAGGNKQNVILLIEAKPGKGKSYAALDLAIWTAIELSKLKGKEPWHYFNMDHVAIINPDEIVRVIDSMHQHGIYIFDDFGVGYSARDWQSDSNKAMNNMLQTIRTDNNILILTVPDSDWIDKVGRNILHFKIVMEQAMFGLGRTMGKLTIEEKMYNTSSKKVMHQYFKTPTEIYNNVMFAMPSKNIAQEYDRRRKYQLDMLKAQAKEDYKNAKADGSKLPKNQKAESLMGQVEEYIRCRDDGLTIANINKRLKDVYGDIAYNVKYLSNYARENGMYA